MLQLVEAIAKWSMADVFVVALFIAYLAAQASQTPPGDPNVPPRLFSLAAQQMTAGWFTRPRSDEA